MRQVDNPKQFRLNISNELNKFVDNKRMSENMEKGIFNFSITRASSMNIVKKWNNVYFVHIYVDRFRSVLLNLRDNSELVERIKSKTIRAHEIGFLTHQEMKPERWQKLLDAKKIRDENKYAPQIHANTDNFECRKCKSNRCSYYQLQTRSADEPMTTFVTCIDCGNRWKC